MLLCTNCAFYSERTQACTKYWKPAVEVRQDPERCGPEGKSHHPKIGLVVVTSPPKECHTLNPRNT